MDLSGKMFGYLTVLRPGPTQPHGKPAKWYAQCTCGVFVLVSSDGWTRKNRPPSPLSCGCQTRSIQSAMSSLATHRMSKHPAYAVWRSMLDRCRLPTHQAWRNYGARGIRVCRRWQKFENFWYDMGSSYRQGLTLERRDNDKGYSLKNCYWATYAQQAQNRRNMLPVNMQQLSLKTGIPHSTLLYRWHRNLSMTSSTPDPDRVSWSSVLMGR